MALTVSPIDMVHDVPSTYLSQHDAHDPLGLLAASRLTDKRRVLWWAILH